MDVGDMGSGLFFALAFLLLAAFGYVLVAWFRRMSQRLEGKAQAAVAAQDYGEALTLLKQALGFAGETPDKERRILRQLASLYGEHGVVFDTEDYLALIRQYETLEAKGSAEAFSQIEDVQRLKQKLLDRMPELPVGSQDDSAV
jgi:hypothetical protein